MSYASNLSEHAQDSIPEFYRLITGNETERFTSYRNDLTFLGNKWLARPIKRSGFQRDTEFGAVSVTITALILGTLKRYIANQPVEPTNVTIYRATSSDLSSYIILFDGQITNVAVQGNMIQATCENRSAFLRQRLPRVIYQAFCNHNIFDGGCALNLAAYAVSGKISGIAGNTISCAAWGARPSEWFRGGHVVVSHDMRLITAHSGNTLTLQTAFGQYVVPGLTATAYPGCDGDPETCKNKYNNIAHFLGMPYIPSRNPVIWGFH